MKKEMKTKKEQGTKTKTEKAVFGAGCFWHVEESFRTVKGVLSTTVGFMGGKTKNPSYREVCTGKTGHVEVCLVEYDPKIVSFDELLNVFWNIHDPTQINRQGPDVGVQYKSIIFYYSEKQNKSAIASMKKEQAKYDKAIATEILPAQDFYKAEKYHQRYFEKNKVKSCGI
jgi:peptide-methionine (S)-S-oxide reductase